MGRCDDHAVDIHDPSYYDHSMTNNPQDLITALKTQHRTLQADLSLTRGEAASESRAGIFGKI